MTYSCTACQSDDHEREAHYSARKATACAIAHANAGNAVQARFWGRVAVGLIRKGVRQDG